MPLIGIVDLALVLHCMPWLSDASEPIRPKALLFEKNKQHCSLLPDYICRNAGYLQPVGGRLRRKGSMTTDWRTVEGVTWGRETSDGAGVRLKRVIGQPELDFLDPFLMLDAFGSDEADDYIAGFPPHPHRGIETVTYMLAGRMRHEDDAGHVGVLGPGGVQWMTAGRGIIHSEMPEQEEGEIRGFQLGVNLPAKHKMCPPRYQNIEPGEVPEVTRHGGAMVKIIAGTVDGVEGPVRGIAAAPLYIDVTLPAGTVSDHPVAPDHNAFSYVFAGTAEIGATEEAPGKLVRSGELAVLSQGNAVRIRAGQDGARLILVAGQPLGEPIVKYGPFVMNTKDEILQAINDYQNGTFSNPPTA
jgi:redox-sensitive bicupin YhaK (pirin superfamily)